MEPNINKRITTISGINFVGLVVEDFVGSFLTLLLVVASGEGLVVEASAHRVTRAGRSANVEKHKKREESEKNAKLTQEKSFYVKLYQKVKMITRICVTKTSSSIAQLGKKGRFIDDFQVSTITMGNTHAVFVW